MAPKTACNQFLKSYTGIIKLRPKHITTNPQIHTQINTAVLTWRTLWPCQPGDAGHWSPWLCLPLPPSGQVQHCNSTGRGEKETTVHEEKKGWAINRRMHKKIKKRDRNSKKGHREVNLNKQMVNKNFAPGQSWKYLWRTKLGKQIIWGWIRQRCIKEVKKNVTCFHMMVCHAPLRRTEKW